jgi:hypothetical protein
VDRIALRHAADDKGDTGGTASCAEATSHPPHDMTSVTSRNHLPGALRHQLMTKDDEPSSIDDSAGEPRASGPESAQPWWASDPTIVAARAATEKWIASLDDLPEPVDNSAGIATEVFSGSCWRELRAARNDLDRANARYETAIKNARALGFSWGEIGRLVGKPRQALHRRFRDEVD